MLSQVVNKCSLFGNDGLPRQINRGKVSVRVEAIALKFDFYYQRTTYNLKYTISNTF